ncbi:MAG: xanthine dehydrogenase family protein molybdopterin-binding subunit, partial [Actinomycetota bacterium]|nr:xanthine dehydrogenase family protein molybdopterin-binding subunit [Actinomycetota bacterium]
MSRFHEDPGFLTGRTPFLRDLPDDDCLHVVFVRSIDAHAELTSVGVQDALASPGVVAVLTGADLSLAPFRFYDAIPEPFARPPLVVDRIRTVGELIAVVVADTPANALDAAEAVEVDATPLPALLTADIAIGGPP